jgi:NADH-quinone oxidoreductase subunit N
MWCPDTYEGAPTPITGFLSVGPKAAGFAVLIRVYLTAFGSLRMDWVLVVAVLSALTMTVGNLVALSQTNIKRMLAYSSIAQAGYILIGFVVSSGIGLSGVLLYLLAYLFMNIGAFVVVIIVSNTLDSDEINDYAGLSHRAPGVALAMLFFLWSLAGLPPTGGFIGKFMVFAGAIQSGYLWLAVVGVLNSIVSIFYYFNVVRQMYFVKTEFSSPTQRYTLLSSVMVLCFAFTLLIGLYPEPFIRVARTAAQLWVSF